MSALSPPLRLLPLLFFLWAASLASQATLPPDMVFVQGGTFTMGCTAEQMPDCDTDESPAHEVTLTDFYMGRYEVTQGQWTALFGTNPSHFSSCGANCPVELVSWFDAAVFCNRLSEQQGYTPCYYADAGYTQVYGKSGSTWSLPNTGAVYWKPGANGYRLPTEAEWEYVARGGSLSKGYKYAGTSDLATLKNYCNYWNGGDGYDNMTAPTGTFLPNEISFFDMSGNVWEWCYDWYGGSYYSSSLACAPPGPGTGSFRVKRGGSWNNNAVVTRSAYRLNFFSPIFRDSGLGFRLCRTP